MLDVHCIVSPLCKTKRERERGRHTILKNTQNCKPHMHSISCIERERGRARDIRRYISCNNDICYVYMQINFMCLRGGKCANMQIYSNSNSNTHEIYHYIFLLIFCFVSFGISFGLFCFSLSLSHSFARSLTLSN